jgi:hypothetical protein
LLWLGSNRRNAQRRFGGRLGGRRCDARQCGELTLEIKQFTMQGIVLLRGEFGQLRQSLAKLALPPESINSQRRRAQH